jgi:pimeloyl-ACP methyl ester carboxylesterase
MTLERMTEDGIELAEHLRHRLHKDKIVLLGHSWGSVLGVSMVKRRPDLFAVYVGTGQVTNEAAMMASSWPMVLARARALGNQAAVNQLTAVGPPPWVPLEKSLAWLIWSNELDPGELKWPTTAALPWARFESWLAHRKELAGADYSQRAMYRTLLQTDVLSLGYEFDVPVVFIQGSEDLAVVTSLTKDYFDKIAAPRKDFVLLRNAGHMAMFRERDAFLAALVEHVRPLAAK